MRELLAKGYIAVGKHNESGSAAGAYSALLPIRPTLFLSPGFAGFVLKGDLHAAVLRHQPGHRLAQAEFLLPAQEQIVGVAIEAASVMHKLEAPYAHRREQLDNLCGFLPVIWGHHALDA